MEISEEVKAAYCTLMVWPHTDKESLVVARAFRDTLAELLKAEWKLDHELYETRIKHEDVVYCSSCGQPSNFSQMHKWTFEDYKAKAERLLGAK